MVSSMPPPAMFALLFFGALVAAAISGSVGFGGALLLLPLLTRSVGPEVAVPLLTIAQLVGNLSRAIFGIRSIAWKPALAFLATAVPCSVAGSLCFVAISKSLVTRVIGVAILVFVISKWRGLLEFKVTMNRLVAVGGIVGFLSGLVGSAGPLGAAAFLALDLPPLSYIATEATTAVAMHASKLIIYGHFIPLDVRALRLAILLSAAMICGTWLGKKTVERLSVGRFRVVVGVLLVVLAVQMIVVG
jgi:uncharacterized membrane protein YfcA